MGASASPNSASKSASPAQIIQQEIEAVQKSFEGVKKILDQLDKPRSVVCTVLNVTDVPLILGASNLDHGAFVNPLPSQTIAPRTAAAFGAQSSSGALFTGTEGTVWYNYGTGFRFHWANPWSGTHEVHGAIRDKWGVLAWEAGFLGYPTADEMPTPDSVGRFNHFQNGSIYWTPQTGAHEVHGAIHAKWAELGWEKSTLGYPVSDEADTSDGKARLSRFQKGRLEWDKATGRIDVHTNIEDVLDLAHQKEERHQL
jgi:hypothetical protein